MSIDFLHVTENDDMETTEQEGYYDELAADALLDPRSVDGYSPLIYAESGFTLDPTGALFYRLVMGWR